jgi:hypothetical protein
MWHIMGLTKPLHIQGTACEVADPGSRLLVCKFVLELLAGVDDFAVWFKREYRRVSDIDNHQFSDVDWNVDWEKRHGVGWSTSRTCQR